MITFQEINMTTKVLLLLVFLMGAKVHISGPEIAINTNYIEYKCPSHSIWEKNDTKCSRLQKGYGYHCTETMLQGNIVLVEHCAKPITILAGHYPYTERRGDVFYLTSKPCPDNRFSDRDMPTDSNSTGFYQCSHEKRKCDQPGQQVCSNGNTTTDRSCKCDYKRQYKFTYDASRTIICCGSGYCDCSKKQECNWTTHELTENYVCKEKCKSGEIRKQEPPTYPCVPGIEISTPSPSTVTDHQQTTQKNSVTLPEEIQDGLDNNHILVIVIAVIIAAVVIIVVVGAIIYKGDD